MAYFTNLLNYQNRPLPVTGAPQNWLAASSWGQTVVGLPGNDAIYGDGGGTLVGANSDNTFYVSTSDKVVVAPGGGINTIVTYWGSYILPDNVQNLVVQGDGAYAGGNALDNLITAIGSGEHTINGGGGNNVLTGGTGEDIFLHDKGNSNDVITNFQAGIDEVRLDNYKLFTFDAVHSAMQQAGRDVVLNLGAGDSLTFRNVQVSQFTAHDFMLPLDYSKLQMTFGDEFNTLSVQTSSGGTWNTSFPWAGPTGASTTSNNELQWYINANYGPTSAVKPWTVNNGVLDLTASPTDPSIQQSVGNYRYTSGMLTTYNTFAQTYGYFEMKAELPAGQGLAPAFWLLPEDGSWPPELDVMEVLGSNPTALVTTVHSKTASSASTSTQVADTTVGFHTYGVDWEPDKITWYFDGNEVFQTATPADMNKPMYMVANLAVGGNWPGSPNGSTAFPATMQIDYIRAYATAAAAPMISTFSPDTNIAGDGITKASQLTLAGTSEAFSKVNVFDGPTLIGTAIANGVGAWSLVTGVLADGSHKFSATDTNAAGNTSVASGVLTVKVDTHLPNRPTVQSFAPDTNVIGDGITSANQLTLTGTAEANSTVNVFDGAALVGNAPVNSGGAWAFTTGVLGNGVHQFTATDMDIAGTVSTASSALNATVDTRVPTSSTINSISPVNSSVTGTLGLKVSADHYAGDPQFQVFVDGQQIGGTQSVQAVHAFGQWQDINLTGKFDPNASHQIVVKFINDAWGGPGLDRNIYVGSVSIGGRVIDGARTASNTASLGCVNPNYAIMASNGSAVYNISAAQTSTAGTLSPSGGITNANHLTLAGTADANSAVKVFDGPALLGSAQVNAAGAWTFTTGPLADGTHSFSTTDTNAAGTTSTASSALGVTIDTIAPSPAITNIVQNSNNSAALGGTSEANSTISIYDGSGSTPIGTAVTKNAGTWSFNSGALSNAVHSFTVHATDVAGNTGYGSGPAVFGTAAGQTLTGGPNTLLEGLGASDIFLFAPNFGNNTLAGFTSHIAGPDHDTLSLPGAAFNNSFTQLLAATTFNNTGAIITADARDTIEIPGLTRALMVANPGSFRLNA